VKLSKERGISASFHLSSDLSIICLQALSQRRNALLVVLLQLWREVCCLWVARGLSRLDSTGQYTGLVVWLWR